MSDVEETGTLSRKREPEDGQKHRIFDFMIGLLFTHQVFV
jgi:hypothetical protein